MLQRFLILIIITILLIFGNSQVNKYKSTIFPNEEKYLTRSKINGILREAVINLTLEEDACFAVLSVDVKAQNEVYKG